MLRDRIRDRIGILPMCCGWMEEPDPEPECGASGLYDFVMQGCGRGPPARMWCEGCPHCSKCPSCVIPLNFTLAVGGRAGSTLWGPDFVKQEEQLGH